MKTLPDGSVEIGMVSAPWDCGMTITVLPSGYLEVRVWDWDGSTSYQLPLPQIEELKALLAEATDVATLRWIEGQKACSTGFAEIEEALPKPGEAVLVERADPPDLCGEHVATGKFRRSGGMRVSYAVELVAATGTAWLRSGDLTSRVDGRRIHVGRVGRAVPDSVLPQALRTKEHPSGA